MGFTQILTQCAYYLVQKAIIKFQFNLKDCVWLCIATVNGVYNSIYETNIHLYFNFKTCLFSFCHWSLDYDVTMGVMIWLIINCPSCQWDGYDYNKTND